MNKISVIHHGEAVKVQVLKSGEQVYWNGKRCQVSTVFSDGDVMLIELGSGKRFVGFANFCTTMAQAS